MDMGKLARRRLIEAFAEGIYELSENVSLTSKVR